MSDIKINENLFLEKIELRRFFEFIQNEGYKKIMLNNTEVCGIIENRFFYDDSNKFLNFKVESPLNNGEVKVGVGLAIDKFGNFLLLKQEIDSLPIPNDGLWYWIKIKHKFLPLEEGTVSIGSTGNLVGVGTKFVDVLRGQPNFASRISFFKKNKLNTDLNGYLQSALNPLEYDVVSVTSDNQAQLLGDFSAENDLYYALVGTFTPTWIPNPAHKFIFNFDNVQIILQLEQPSNTAPPHLIDEEFFLARVRNNGGVVEIQDKRDRAIEGKSQIYRTNSGYQTVRIDKNINKDNNPILGSNPLVGIEAVRWDSPASTRDKNQVILGWCLRSTSWTINSTKNELTISSGNGGRWKDISPFQDGMFDGWYVYVKNRGNYTRIIRSEKVAGSIRLNLSIANLLDFQINGEEILIVPDAEEIEFDFYASDYPINNPQHKQVHKTVSFNINDNNGIVFLQAFNEKCTYEVNYRYKHLREYSDWKEIQAGTYYNEDQFTDEGELKSSPAYTGYSQGKIVLKQSQKSYLNSNLFDVPGIDIQTVSASNNFFELEVGISPKILVLKGGAVVNVNVFVSLKNSPNVRKGNSFIIDIQDTWYPNAPSPQYDFKVKMDAQSGNPDNTGTLLQQKNYLEFNTEFFGDSRYYILCTFEGSTWIVDFIAKDSIKALVPIGGIIMWQGAIDKLPPNWKICDGTLGTPNLSGRFVLGVDANKTVNTVGGSFKIEAKNLPKHTHVIQEDGVHHHEIPTAEEGNTSGRIGRAFSDELFTNTTESTGSHNHGGVTSDGDFQNEDYLPPFYALYFIKRIY